MDQLANYGSDSEVESTQSNSDESERDECLHDDEDEEMNSVEDDELDKDTNPDAATEYSSQLRRLSSTGQMAEICLPPGPTAKCDQAIIDKIRHTYMRRMNEGLNYNELIKMKKSYRNPSIYEKLIEFMDIDEGGSNFPKDVFDPKTYRNDKENDYVAIANVQRKQEERRQTAMKERSKIEFAAAKSSKWDGPAVVEKNQISSSKRSIPAVGQLAKEKSRSRK